MKTSKFRVFIPAALIVCALFAAPMHSPAEAGRHDSTCDITGTVTKVEHIERSPWTDGTPSTLSVYETHLQISIHNRRPHRKDAPADSPCNKALEKNEMRVYKLCSNTRPSQGNRVTGTEGGSPGASTIKRCLFDLVVLPDPDAPKKN